MNCPSCGVNVAQAAKFCSQCGAALPRACAACGNSNPADSKFCSECGAILSPGSTRKAATTPSLDAKVPTASSAERRQVTVMFSDLVGSTALAARMDPEDLREIISAYQKCVAETVRRFDGFVAKYLGDGVLVYFGYPQAHEDDAERAVRAGLELMAAVVALKTRASLQTRIGIATGLVVVGDLIGSGDTQEAADREEVQRLIDGLAAAGIDAHGEMLSAAEHDIAEVILQRARDRNVDLIVLGHQHHRGAGNLFQSDVTERVIRQHPPCSILLTRPPGLPAGSAGQASLAEQATKRKE
jgi:nucleotide-binding universal stress UspA family protein/predicted nucleic acid-binding Zn ribbon protein